MDLEQIYRIFQKHPCIVTDSRKAEKGSIFFALKGENFNGNEFAEAALKQGCSYAVVDEPEYAQGERFILVEDTLTLLQQLARKHRRTLGIPIIAITGSNGKTTTKELVNSVLSKKYKTFATQGNYNNHIGVPLTLLAMNSAMAFGIVEMGANHPGEIKNLCEIAEPDYGIITNVGKAHLEGFGSFDMVKATKKELYDHLEKTGGKVFVNADNHHLKQMLNVQETITYGKGDDVYSSGKFLQAKPFMVMELSSTTGKLHVKTRLIGAYNFENALAAATVGRYFAIDEVLIKNALENYTPQNNRSQLKKTEKNVLFLDAYNANPTSMRLAIENFANLSLKNSTTILGDMLELGIDSEKEHSAIVDLLKEKNFKEIFLVGKIFCGIKGAKAFKRFQCVEELTTFLQKEPLVQNHILIKGSRGICLEKAVSYL